MLIFYTVRRVRRYFDVESRQQAYSKSYREGEEVEEDWRLRVGTGSPRD